ncbi:isoprenoid biosynthesis glyoxalase ElbB [bacterium]|nr:isoprenoid biosynthesis glyoxalase ElbB [bacterium]
MAKIAVILSGCGVYDGAEIHESVATLAALDRAGAQVTVAAPDIPQMHVVDHQRGEPAADQTRNVRVEAARIARGPVADVKDLRAADFDAVILPGGFGAAKNLCTFAVDGADCSVNPDVAAFLRAMNAGGKVIGAMCIAPALVARIFGADGGVDVTIGTDPDTAAAVEAMGARHVDCPPTGVVVDAERRVVSTPAYMNAGRIGEVFQGIEKLVATVLDLAD